MSQIFGSAEASNSFASFWVIMEVDIEDTEMMGHKEGGFNSTKNAPFL